MKNSGVYPWIVAVDDEKMTLMIKIIIKTISHNHNYHKHNYYNKGKNNDTNVLPQMRHCLRGTEAHAAEPGI
jgi:hypothetical protein